MSKYSILNFGLLLAIVALVAFVIYDPTELHGPQPQSLTTIDPATIDTIEIRQHNQSKITLQKQQTADGNGHWEITNPLAIAASTPKMKRLMGLLAANSIRQYTIAKEQLTKFGLAPAQWEIQFNQQTIRFGNTDAINQNRYVQVGDNIHLITDRYSHQIADLPLSLASLALLPDSKDIRSIQTPSMHLVNNDGSWQLSPEHPGQPTDTTITSQDNVNTFIDEWRYAQALRLSYQQQTLHQKTSAAETIQQPDADNRTRIIIQTGNKPDITHFVIMDNSDDFSLLHEELGIVYHLSNSAKERLLNLPQ